MAMFTCALCRGEVVLDETPEAAAAMEQEYRAMFSSEAAQAVPRARVCTACFERITSWDHARSGRR